MPFFITRIAALRDVAETLVFAAIGGLTLGLSGMPAGYLSGSILAVACAALAGRPMHVPMPIMQVLLILIGISLGAVVSPETLQGVTAYPLSIAVLILASIAIAVVGSSYLRIVHGWDTLTAYLSAVPGGLSQVMALAVELKADVRAVVIVQTLRIIIIAIGFPALLTALGLVHGAPRTVGGTFVWSQLDELAVLIAISSAMAYVAYRIRFPGGLLFGAMLTSAALHGTGMLHAVLPWWMSYAVMIAFGAVSGSRFADTSARMLLRYVGAAFGSFATALTVTAAFAATLVQFVTVPPAEVMIAYAPGASDAMMLLALALNLDPVYVGAHHLTRIFFVLMTMPWIVRRQAQAIRATAATPRPPQGDGF